MAIEAAVARGFTAQRIWQDLREQYGFGSSYSSVKRFVRRVKQAQWRRCGATFR